MNLTTSRRVRCRPLEKVSGGCDDAGRTKAEVSPRRSCATCNYLVALGDTRLLSAICRGGHWEWEQWEGPDGDVEETGLKTGGGAMGKVKNKTSPRPLFTVLDWRREAKLLSSQPFGEQGMKEERESERE
jgi:hypothetical protein